ncbi:MAG TPA: zinc-binding dehydrogenase [Blastocatellia bacterium]|jgi:NADPH:quinone reductase-like Zn-dependent oxidoreductase|nr:zinc-binding dehydrogenase [Blastocatellia bacterium]
MKAVVINQHGSEDVLEYTELPEPEISENEVLVQVKACALNHLDLWIRGGLPGLKLPFPHVLGADVSGVAVKVGKLVENTRPGDEVMLSPGISCMHCEYCLSGRDNLCASYSLLGTRVPGGYAEFVKAPSFNVLPKPRNLSFEEAASLPLVFITAWHMLVERVRLQAGETLLVHAAGSGVGIAAIQIGKLLGARVLTTASSDEKLRKASALGADELINYTEKDFLDEVRRLTDKRGVDVVFEHTGEATWEKSVRSLVRGGRLVTCGATSGYHGNIDIRYLFSKQISLIGSYMGSKYELVNMLKFFEDGSLKPVVDRVLPLERAADAHRAVQERAQFGKVVLTPQVRA